MASVDNNFPGAYRGEKKEEEADVGRARCKKEFEPAMDQHAHRHKDHHRHEHSHGRSDSLAGHSFQRLAGRDPLGIAVWRFDLGDFLWQYPDQQVLAQKSVKAEAVPPDAAWEAIFALYDPFTYQAVLERIGSDDVILDIGAGDLRLDRQMARIVRKVYAVEVNARVLDQAGASRDPLPAKLIPICADARALEFPPDVTAGVLLIRHCTCFRLYAEKLRKAGAQRLITNARWRMGVEVVDLLAEGKPFAGASMGWYACLCGAVGFKQGPVEHWTFETDKIVHEVSSCPQCM